MTENELKRLAEIVNHGKLLLKTIKETDSEDIRISTQETFDNLSISDLTLKEVDVKKVVKIHNMVLVITNNTVNLPIQFIEKIVTIANS